jgi:hypothetical protein
MMIREEHADRRVRCPKCGLVVLAIPPTAVLVDKDDLDLDPEGIDRSPPRSSAAGASIGLWVAGIIGGVLLLCAGVGVTTYYLLVRPLIPPSLPESVVLAKGKAVQLHGEGRVLTLETTRLEGERLGVVNERLRALLSSAQFGFSRIPEGDRNYYVLHPVHDLNQFVEGIDFGKVTRISRRHRHVVIEVDEEKLAAQISHQGPPPGGPPPRVTVECKGLVDSGVSTQVLRDRFVQALRELLPSLRPEQQVIVTRFPAIGSDSYLVRILLALDLDDIRTRIDFGNVVSSDPRTNRIVVEFTPEQIAALKGQSGAGAGP